MQFKNTSDIALQTDTDQHNAGGELHAKLLWRRQGQATLPVGGGRNWLRDVGLAAMPVGGGGARASTRTKHRPIGGRRVACGAWPGFETTRRAKLAARTASGRAGHAAAGDQAGLQGDQAGPQAAQEPLNGIAKGAGISRPLARVPSLIHEGHLDAAHQRGDDVVEHGSQRRQGGEQNDVDDRDDGRVGDDARQAGVVQ